MKRNLVLLGILCSFAAVAVASYLSRPQPAQPGDGAPLVNVSVPTLTADQQLGEAAFQEFCATCHGKDGAGQEGVAPPLVHRIYEPGHHGDQAFFIAAQNGVRAHHWPFGNMPPVDGVSDQDVANIVEYVRALQRANGIQ